MGNAISSLSDAGRALYDKVANIFGADNIIITSTLRNGTGTSQHNVGDAFDFKIKGMNNADVQSIIAGSGLSYNQLINEISGPASSGPHLHIGTGTGNENLTYQNGKYSLTTSLGDSLRAMDKWVGKALGLPDSVNDPLHDPNASIGDVVTGAASSLFSTDLVSRLTYVVIGVILIGLAIAAFVFLTDNKLPSLDGVK